MVRCAKLNVAPSRQLINARVETCVLLPDTAKTACGGFMQTNAPSSPLTSIPQSPCGSPCLLESRKFMRQTLVPSCIENAGYVFALSVRRQYEFILNYECSVSTNSATAQTSHVRSSQCMPTTGPHRSTKRPSDAAGVTTPWDWGLHGTNECNVVYSNHTPE